MTLRSERIVLACSAPFLVGGLLALPIAASWAGKGAGAAMAIGASIALASTHTPIRGISLTLALLAAGALVWLS
jgi:hypothetical protein